MKKSVGGAAPPFEPATKTGRPGARSLLPSFVGGAPPTPDRRPAARLARPSRETGASYFLWGKA